MIRMTRALGIDMPTSRALRRKSSVHAPLIAADAASRWRRRCGNFRLDLARHVQSQLAVRPT
jgi:hypothetical protein